MHKRLSRGFTIVEIATVVFVIAVLATITVVAYNNVQGQSRDTDRANDMTVLGSMLEKYYDRNGAYPPGCGTATCNSGSGAWIYPTQDTIGTPTTLSQLSTIFNQTGVSTIDPVLNTQTTPFIGAGYTISNSAPGYIYRGGQTNVTGSNTIYLVKLTETSSARQCTVNVTINTTPGTDTAGYMLAYYAESTQTWNVYVGNRGAKPFIDGTSTAGFCQIMN